MKHKFSFVDRELRDARNNNLYRSLRYGTVSGSHITTGSKTLLNLCSNDYLGMSPTPVEPEQMQSSSRLLSGNDESYQILEKKLSRHKSYKSSLVYPTGYMANIGVIPTLAGKGDRIFSDELNHASIIEACRLSGAKTVTYSHNDMDDLRAKVKQKSRNKFIITEGIFSMDGDLATLPQIAEIAQNAGAITIVDDAHGDFAIGRDGKGTPNSLHVAKKIDIYISSLSKGLGSFGGYVSSRDEVIQMCTNKSKAFIYTSALPSPLVWHASRRLDCDREKYRKKLLSNVRAVAAGLAEAGCNISSKSHIMPLIIGDEKKALKVGKFLYDNGVFVQPVRYPTVPKGGARLRISVTAWLSQDDIGYMVQVFAKAVKKFRI